MSQLGPARDRWIKNPVRVGGLNDYTDGVTQFDPSADSYISFMAWIVYGQAGQSLRLFTQNTHPSGVHYLTLRSTGESEWTFISSISGSSFVSETPSDVRYNQPRFYAGRVDVNNASNSDIWRGGLHAPPRSVKKTSAANGSPRPPKSNNYLKLCNFLGGGGNTGCMSLVVWKNYLITLSDIYEFWRHGNWKVKPYGAWRPTRNGLWMRDFSGNNRNYPTAAFDGKTSAYATRTRKRWVAVPQWWIPDVAGEYSQAAAGTLTSAGTIAKKTEKDISGVLSSTGALSKETDKDVNGVLSFVGTINRQVDRDLAGALSFSGALAISKLYARSVDGSLSFVGVLVKDVDKNVAGVLGLDGSIVKDVSKLLSGSLGFSGDVSRQIDRDVDGVLSFSGGLTTIKSFTRSVDGALTSSGSLTYVVEKSLVGSLSLDATLVRDIFKLVAGTLTSTGNLNKETYKSFDGAFTFAGALASIKLATQSTSGVLTLNGVVLTEINKYLSGLLSLNGGLVKDIDKPLSGVLSFSGNLNAQLAVVNQATEGDLSFSGSLSAVHIPFVPGSTKSSSARGPFTARYRRVIT